jgi:hypothetical protein
MFTSDLEKYIDSNTPPTKQLEISELIEKFQTKSAKIVYPGNKIPVKYIELVGRDAVSHCKMINSDYVLNDDTFFVIFLHKPWPWSKTINNHIFISKIYASYRYVIQGNEVTYVHEIRHVSWQHLTLSWYNPIAHIMRLEEYNHHHHITLKLPHPALQLDLNIFGVDNAATMLCFETEAHNCLEQLLIAAKTPLECI